ncbi:hypothetical protein [Nocardia miyunensis]|uniref:hypothetical protein n=1 Tax=Nocardia miyunensis TaxID=282684 RepID=UPI000AE7712E|nr:hypothetical protein [Nocardia miyunensis]
MTAISGRADRGDRVAVEQDSGTAEVRFAALAVAVPTFLRACVTVLWVVAAVGGVLSVLTLALPRRPRVRS